MSGSSDTITSASADDRIDRGIRSEAEPVIEATAQPLDEMRQPEPPPPPQPAAVTTKVVRERSSLLPGLVGGVLASVAVIALAHYSGWLNRPDIVLAQRVAALESLPPQVAGTASQVSGVEAGLGQIGDRVAALEARPEAAPPPEVDLSPLRSDIAGLREAQAGVTEQLQQDRTSLEALTAKVDNGLKELTETTGGLALSLSEQRSRLDTVAGEVKALQGQKADLEPLSARIAASEAAVDAGNARAADLEARLASLEGALAAAKLDSAQTARLALAVVELDGALDAGDPLAAALQPFGELAANDASLAAPVQQLEVFAGSGAPTVQALQARLADLAPKIAAAAAGSPGDDWVAETARNLANLVNLRQVGADEAAIRTALQNAEASLARGDVRGAVTAMQPLADAGNPGAADWLALARQRLEADSAVERIRAYLAARLDGTQ
ncbi:MAG: hypothetical protein U1E14_12240 [Geminicoccaceae bacterium]